MNLFEQSIKDKVMERANGHCECNYPFHKHDKKHGKFGDEFYFRWSHGYTHNPRPTSGGSAIS